MLATSSRNKYPGRFPSRNVSSLLVVFFLFFLFAFSFYRYMTLLVRDDGLPSPVYPVGREGERYINKLVKAIATREGGDIR